MAIYALGDRVPDIHPDAFVHPDATVIGSVVIGPESSVWPRAVLRGDYGFITVGARTSIQDGSVIHTTEDAALVGSGSIVLHGAIVRTNALVGAAALVPNGMEIPSGAMALGVPAR